MSKGRNNLVKRDEEESIFRQVAKMLCIQMSHNEIKEFTGLKDDDLAEVLKDPRVGEEMCEIQRMVLLKSQETEVDVRQIIADTALYSAKILQEVVVSGQVRGLTVPPRDRLKAAESMMDRAGYGPANKNINLNVSDADSLVQIYDNRKKKELENKEKDGKNLLQ